jgi:hypothetical protein
MKHPWERLHDLTNTLGLILGATGIIIIGIQLNNSLIITIGIISIIFFGLFGFILLYLFVRDYRKSYPNYKRGFWIIKY